MPEPSSVMVSPGTSTSTADTATDAAVRITSASVDRYLTGHRCPASHGSGDGSPTATAPGARSTSVRSNVTGPLLVPVRVQPSILKTPTTTLRSTATR